MKQDYSKQTAKAHFEAGLKAAMIAPHKPLKKVKAKKRSEYILVI